MTKRRRWIGLGGGADGWSRAVALALLAGLLALRLIDPVPVQTLRNAAFDLFQQLDPRVPAPAPVAILDIDDPSLEEIGQWPWPRTVIADLVDRTAQAGAAAMAFDIVFAEPDRYSPARYLADVDGLPDAAREALAALPSNDAVLADALARFRVVLGETSVRSADFNREARPDMAQVPHAVLGADPKPFLIRFPDLLPNLPELEAQADGFGVFTVRPDPDGVYRRVPLVMLVQDRMRLGLSAELLRVATGGDAFAVRSNEAGVDGVVVARQFVRTEADGTVWPHFSPSSRARYVSAADLLQGRVPENRLRGHLVLVGTSAIGLEDFRATPLGVPMAGVEIHAQVLENILGGSMLLRPNYAIAVELLTIAVLSLVVIILVPVISARWIIALTVVLLAAYAGGTFWAFDRHRLLLDPTFPLLATVASMMLMSSGNYLREERQRRQIRTAFGQYVSPALVADLADRPDRLVLGGETRELTVLFSDVRGFTTISESFKSDPAGLTALMNAFLTVLSNAILSREGTIDKFMGDAVMAFWNAPLPQEDHPRRSCEAALEMLREVAALNARREAEAAPGDTVHRIDIGIGINTGTCVVGNMGSDKRFDYTALGDAVNLASRLEGQAKAYGLPVILGAATAAAVSRDMAVIELDLVRVKGKTEPERVHALLGDAQQAGDPAFKALARENDAFLALYRAQDWAEARKALDRTAEAAGRMDLDLSGLLALHGARIAEFEADPPPPDWDGAHTLTTK